MFQKIRELSKNLAIYGLADVAVSVINFLLLPIYVRYLTPQDYGALALLGSVEAIAKVFFRMGLDGSFMRLFYEYEDTAARQRMTSSIFFFLLAVNGFLLVVSLLLAPALSDVLFGGGGYLRALQLTLLNTFAIGFTFFPFHVLRMEKRAAQFSVLTLARSLVTVVLRITLVVGVGFGVLGVVLADIVVTTLVLIVLVRWFEPLIRPVFSSRMLREALHFGLPRVPHALAQQALAVGDKFILTALRPLQEVGVYSIGVSFGLTQKLFLSAFEYAWAPFYYENAKAPDAKRLFSSLTTYGVAVLALITAGLSAIGRDLLAAVTHSQAVHYVAAGEVVTWTAVGVFFQGVYLLTSIGLNLTKHTQYYPLATISAATANIVLNVALVPRFGMMGAAWANAVTYALQALLAFRFSQRFYPVKYEARRILTVVLCAVVASLAGRALPTMPAVLGVLTRGGTVVLLYGGLLRVGGFWKPEELRALRRLGTWKPRPRSWPAPEVTEMGGEIIAAETSPDELNTQLGAGALAGRATGPTASQQGLHRR